MTPLLLERAVSVFNAVHRDTCDTTTALAAVFAWYEQSDAAEHANRQARLLAPVAASPALQIIRLVASVTGVATDEIRGNSRVKSIADARAIAIYVIANHLGNIIQAGRELKRDNTTARVAIQKVRKTPHLLAIARAALSAFQGKIVEGRVA